MPFGALLQVGVEVHRKGADQELATFSHPQASRFAQHQTITLLLLQTGDLRREVGRKIQSEFPAHGGVVEAQITHQAHDHRAAAQVIVAQGEPALNRQAAGLECGFVVTEFLVILTVGAVRLGDGRHPEGAQFMARAVL